MLRNIYNRLAKTSRSKTVTIHGVIEWFNDEMFLHNQALVHHFPTAQQLVAMDKNGDGQVSKQV